MEAAGYTGTIWSNWKLVVTGLSPAQTLKSCWASLLMRRLAGVIIILFLMCSLTFSHQDPDHPKVHGLVRVADRLENQPWVGRGAKSPALRLMTFRKCSTTLWRAMRCPQDFTMFSMSIQIWPCILHSLLRLTNDCNNMLFYKQCMQDLNAAYSLSVILLVYAMGVHILII